MLKSSLKLKCRPPTSSLHAGIEHFTRNPRGDIGIASVIRGSPGQRRILQEAAARERDSRTLSDLYALGMRWAGCCYLLPEKNAQPQLADTAS